MWIAISVCMCVYMGVWVFIPIHTYVCAFVCVFVYHVYVLYNWFSCALGTEWYTGVPSLVKAYIPYRRILDLNRIMQGRV